MNRGQVPGRDRAGDTGHGVPGTHHLGEALQSGTRRQAGCVVGMVAPGSSRVRAKAGDLSLWSVRWGGRGLRLDQFGAGSAREMGWAGAGHCGHPSTSPNPSFHPSVPNIHQCSPVPAVTEDPGHPTIYLARSPRCPPTSQYSLIPGSMVLKEEGSGPPSPVPRGMERAQRQFCSETPGLRLASSLGGSGDEDWAARRAALGDGSAGWWGHQEMGPWRGGLLEDGFVLERWIMSMGCPAIRDAQPTPSPHPPTPGPFHVKMPRAGSWTDAGERGWIRAKGGGTCAGAGLAARAGVSTKPGFAPGHSGWGKEESWEG